MSAVRKRIGLYRRFQQNNYQVTNVAMFIRALLRHLQGPVILVWDHGRIHKGPFITPVQRDYPRLYIESFPGYAPELHPTEQIWNDFKSHTANSLYRDKQHLRSALHTNARRVRRSQAKWRSFVLTSDLPSPPW